MSGTWPPSYGTKPAAAYLNYAYSLVAEIAQNEPTDTIVSATVVPIPSDGSLVVSLVLFMNGVVTFWLSGGQVGAKYRIVVTATMASGRVIVSDPVPVLMVV